MLESRTAWPGERFDTLGAYFRPAQARLFVPVGVLTDRIVALEDVWRGRALENELGETRGDAERLELLEAGLLRRLAEKAEKQAAINLPALAAFVHRQRGRMTVQHLADAAGVSRQHLARTFREGIGVTPKMYCRLARFRASLAYAGGGAGMAADLGYFDQSHMIAEFKEFSGLTPGTLAAQRYFHPFA
jgi:AraC-like DNA-binding protein